MNFLSNSVLSCKTVACYLTDYKTNVRKFSVSINEAKIISIIRKLSPNKAHGCDNISIRMLKICDTVITKIIKIIYEKCTETDRFPFL